MAVEPGLDPNQEPADPLAAPRPRRPVHHAPAPDVPITPKFSMEPALLPAMEEWRQQASASLLFHMQRRSGGYDWAPAVPALVTRFFTMVGDPQTAADALAKDVNSLYALTDQELAMKVARGEKLSELGDVWDAVADVAWEVGAREVATRMAQEKATAVKGKFEALTSSGLAEAGVTQVKARGGVGGEAAQLLRAFNQPGAWSWDREGGILAVTVGEGDDARTIGVRPGPKFDPKNELDVLTEVLRTFQSGDQSRVFGELVEGGKAIEWAFGVTSDIGRFIEDRPHLREFVDGLWEAFQEGHSFGDADPLEKIRAEQDAGRVEALQQASLGAPFPEEMFVATFAERLMAEAGELGIQLPDEVALAAAGDLVTEDKDALADEWQKTTAPELIAEIEAAGEDESPLATALNEELKKVIDAMNWWEAVTQTIGVAAVDTAGDLIDAANKSLTLEATWEDFKETFVTVDEARTVGDYFNLKGSAYDLANLTTSLFFDPVNAVFPGAKGARALFVRAMTNPKFAPWYLATPGVRSVTKQIAETTGREAISNVLYLDGLSEDGYRALFQIARKPNATVKEVDDVLLGEINNGYFLGAGPTRAIRTSTIEGMGKMVDAVHDAVTVGGKKSLSDDQLDTVLSLFAQLNRTRTFAVGENVGLSNFFDLLHQFYPTDADGMLRWADEAVNAISRKGEVPNQAVQGVLTAQKQAARQELAKTNSIRSRATRDPDGIKENIFEVDSSLSRVDDLDLEDEAKEQVRVALRDARARLQTELEATTTMVETSRNSAKTAHQQLAKTTRAEADLAVNRDRAAIADLLYRFYDDLAEQINKEFGEDVIPILRDARGAAERHPLAPEVMQRDWSAVTGGRRGGFSDEDLSVVMGLAIDDPTLTRELNAIGLFSRNQKVILPASPYEVMLFRKIAHNPEAWAKVTNKLRANRMSGAIRTVKLMFGTNLLMNPITAFKVTLDETFRFLASEGAPLKFGRSTFAGAPGSAALYRGVADGLKKIPGFKSIVPSDTFGEFITNPYALQYSRGHGGFMGNEAYEWVTPTTKGLSRQDYVKHAERWVNGTLLNDDLFKAYARFVTGPDVVRNPAGGAEMPEGFARWWETGEGTSTPGFMHARASELTIGKRSVPIENTAAEVWRVMDNAFNTWIEKLVKEGQQNSLRRRLLQAAAGNAEPLSVAGSDAGLLRAIQQIPAPVESGRTNGMMRLLGRGFDTMFGGPSQRRGGVFFEHYFDEAMGIYRQRFGSKNRVITPELIVENTGVSLADARAMVRQGSDNSVVRWLMDGAGATTERAMAAHAARYAQIRADDLMYRFTASSLIGQGVESGLLWPYARAQLDFLSWWTNHMTTGLRIRPGLAQVLERFPGGEALVRGVEGVPLNVRALAKYAHINAAVNNDERSLFDQAVDQLTFFPTTWTSEFLMDVLPQPGPLPSWIVDRMGAVGAIDEQTMALIDTIFPAMGFLDDSTNLFDRVFPYSPRSLRRQTWAATQALAIPFGSDPNKWDAGIQGAWTNFISDNKLPPATGDYQAAAVAEFLTEKALDLPPGSDEWHAEVNRIAVEAAMNANKKDIAQTGKDVASPFAKFDREYKTLVSYGPMLEGEIWEMLQTLEVLSASDLFDDGGQPRIQAAYERWENGTATDDDKEYLADTLYRIYSASADVVLKEHKGDADHAAQGVVLTLQDVINLTSPGVAVNLVSKNEGTPGMAITSDEHRDFVAKHIDSQTGRLQNVPPGKAGSDLVAEARRRGWVVTRPMYDTIDGGWAMDAHEAVLKSSRDAINAAWFHITGRTWAQGEPPKALAGASFNVDDQPFVSKVLAMTGLELEPGTSMTVGEFRELLADHRFRFKNPNGPQRMLITEGPIVSQLARDDFGLSLLHNLDDAADQFEDQGIDRFDEWPEPVLQNVRDAVKEAINLGLLKPRDYEQQWQELFGPLDYEPPNPPPVAELDAGIRITPEQIKDGSVEAIDGDTVSLLMEDGALRVRFLGINAPERTQPGHTEATENLIRLLDGANEVVLGIYQPELFGTTQKTAPGESRLFAWLYVDGVPIYDPSLFTASNPRGAGVGGTVLDLQSILEAGK